MDRGVVRGQCGAVAGPVGARVCRGAQMMTVARLCQADLVEPKRRAWGQSQ